MKRKSKLKIQAKYFHVIFIFLLFTLLVSLKALEKKSQSNIPKTLSVYLDSRDNKEYEIILIDSLWWFNEDLLFQTPGSRLPDSDQYRSRLYPFNESRIICPKGWRLPSIAEFDILIERLAGVEHTGLVDLPYNWENINKNESGIKINKTNMFQKKKLVSPNSFNMWLADDSNNEAYHVHLYDVDESDNSDSLTVFRHTHEEHNPIRNKRFMAVRCVCELEHLNEK